MRVCERVWPSDIIENNPSDDRFYGTSRRKLFFLYIKLFSY